MPVPLGGRRKAAAVLAVALLLQLGTIAAGVDEPASAAASPLPRVQQSGDDLVAGGKPFKAWGFNYGLGARYPILDYFDNPTDARLRRVVSDMREARSLGANTVRVYLELKAFMRKPGEPRRRTLDALARLLRRAERVGIYLDITGNLVWRGPPAWYDTLAERDRWKVQARFWGAVARTSRGFSSVLVYELTSEPKIARNSDSWYTGELGGYTFIQNIVRNTAGRDPRRLARRWIRLLRDSIRRHDDRHLVSVGLLPWVEGPFAPANTAHLLDALVLHVHPAEGEVDSSIDTVRRFASRGKPVILGETAPLWAGPETWAAFLLGSRRYLDGYLSYYDGRTSSEVGTGAADTWYAATLDQFLDLKASLLGAN